MLHFRIGQRNHVVPDEQFIPPAQLFDGRREDLP